MKPDPDSSAEQLRVRARAVLAASQELRAHARALRERTSRSRDDTTAVGSRLSTGLEPWTMGDPRPSGSTPNAKPFVREPSATTGPGKTDGRASLTPLGPLFERVAQTLEHSARLAEEHAAREHAAGRPALAEQERSAARHARDAAARSRDLARHHNRIDGSGRSMKMSDRDDTGGQRDNDAPPRPPQQVQSPTEAPEITPIAARATDSASSEPAPSTPIGHGTAPRRGSR